MPVVVVAGSHRNLGADLLLDIQRHVPARPTVAESFEHIVGPHRVHIGLSEVRIRNRAALPVEREIRQVAVRNEVIVRVAPGPGDGVHRRVDRIQPVRDAGPFLADVLAEGKLERRPAVSKHVVGHPDAGADVFPLRQPVDPGETSCLDKPRGGDVLRRHVPGHGVVSQAIVNRHPLEGPLILDEDRQVGIDAGLGEVGSGVLGDAHRALIQELILQILNGRQVPGHEPEAVVGAQLLDGQSHFDAVGSRDVRHRRALIVPFIQVRVSREVRTVGPAGRPFDDPHAGRSHFRLQKSVPVADRRACRGLEEQPVRERHGPRDLRDIARPEVPAEFGFGSLGRTRLSVHPVVLVVQQEIELVAPRRLPRNPACL